MLNIVRMLNKFNYQHFKSLKNILTIEKMIMIILNSLVF
jgi:hypothetical protein